MDQATQALIQALHRSAYRYCLVATGGGARALAMLLDVPGGSRTVLECLVPYGAASLNEFLGRPPENYCSASTGRDMAWRAYERAQWLVPGEPAIGLACTASLVSDCPKRGDHRVHISVVSSTRLQSSTLVLIKQARSRLQEEAVVDALILNALADAAGIAERVEPRLLSSEVIQQEAGQGDRLAALLSGEVPAVRIEPDGRIDNPERRPALIVAGSFHPVHPGHWRLAEAGAALTGLPAEFELSVANADKPALSVEEIRRRMRQFSWRAPLWLTRAPTFVEKARLFPESVFAVGADTAMRIVAPRYYGGSDEAVDAALDEIRQQECRFLVAGRHDAAGHLTKLADLKIPDAWRELFQEIPESECCVPLSSTELRRAEEAARYAGQKNDN